MITWDDRYLDAILRPSYHIGDIGFPQPEVFGDQLASKEGAVMAR